MKLSRLILVWFLSSVAADALTTYVGIKYGHGAEGNRITATYSMMTILAVSTAAKLFVLCWSRFMRLWAAWLYPTTLAVLGAIYWAFSLNNLRVGV